MAFPVSHAPAIDPLDEAVIVCDASIDERENGHGQQNGCDSDPFHDEAMGLPADDALWGGLARPIARAPYRFDPARNATHGFRYASGMSDETILAPTRSAACDTWL